MSEIESINDLNADLFSTDEVDHFSDPKEARKKAMDYLARREYGQQELEQKLVAAGFAAVAATETVNKLKADGLQDDRRFIESFVQSRINQGKGPVRIRQDLGDRGVTEGMIDEALEEVTEDWHALARQIREKKFGRDLPREFRAKARQMRFLQYRGFESGHIQAAFSLNGED